MRSTYAKKCSIQDLMGMGNIVKKYGIFGDVTMIGQMLLGFLY